MNEEVLPRELIGEIVKFVDRSVLTDLVCTTTWIKQLVDGLPIPLILNDEFLRKVCYSGDLLSLIKTFSPANLDFYYWRHHKSYINAFRLACMKGHLRIVKYMYETLLNLGVTLDEKWAELRNTGFIMACWKNRTNVVRWLLKQEMPIICYRPYYHRNKDVLRIHVWYACLRGYRELIELSLPHDENEKEYYPEYLKIARKTKHKDVEELILRLMNE